MSICRSRAHSALRAVAHAALKADQLLLAFRSRAHQHQHTFPVFHAGLKEEAIGPYVHYGRANRSRLCRRSYSHCHAVVNPETTAGDRLGSVCPATPPAPTGAMPAWIVRRAMTMPDDTGAPVSSPSAWQEMFHLRSQYRVPEAAAHDTQGIRQWSVDLVGLTKRANVARRIHGVSLSLGGSGRLDTRRDTRPISGRHSPRPRIAPYQVLQRDFWSAKPVSLRLGRMLR